MFRKDFQSMETFKAGVENLWPAWTFDMVRVKIFVTQVRVKHRVETKLHDKQVLRQKVKRSLSSS